MESPFGLPTVHWDLEPRQLVGRGVLSAPRLGGLGTARPTLRFMESPLGLAVVHWDHEPTHPRARPPPRRPAAQSRTKTKCRFMESLLGLAVVHWDHEPADRP